MDDEPVQFFNDHPEFLAFLDKLGWTVAFPTSNGDPLDWAIIGSPEAVYKAVTIMAKEGSIIPRNFPEENV